MNLKRAGVILTVAGCFGLIALLYVSGRNKPLSRQPIISARSEAPEHRTSTRVVTRKSLTSLDGEDLKAFKKRFDEKLLPAFKTWSSVYGSHLPFAADDLTYDKFVGQVGRGDSQIYNFMLNGITISLSDTKRGTRIMYLSAPSSEKLTELPRGEQPDISTPVNRAEVASLLKADSGVDFRPEQIRITPTAFSSSLTGGAQVTVGGDPLNAASWDFTIVFQPDGKLAYYLRGAK